jgi:hypothetical protein
MGKFDYSVAMTCRDVIGSTLNAPQFSFCELCLVMIEIAFRDIVPYVKTQMVSWSMKDTIKGGHEVFELQLVKQNSTTVHVDPCLMQSSSVLFDVVGDTYRLSNRKLRFLNECKSNCTVVRWSHTRGVV